MYLDSKKQQHNTVRTRTNYFLSPTIHIFLFLRIVKKISYFLKFDLFEKLKVLVTKTRWGLNTYLSFIFFKVFNKSL